MDRIQEAGADLLACSTDSVHTARVFSASLGTLPFPIASDWMRQASKDYGVLQPDRGYATRSVFIIDGQGRVIFENPAFSATNIQHYEQAVAALEV